MRINIIIFLAALLILPVIQLYSVYNFGIGIILGEPTGLCAKYWLNTALSMDYAAAWSFVEPQMVYMHLDVQYHYFGINKRINDTVTDDVNISVPLYIGAGIKIYFDDSHFQLGFRIPFGVDLIFYDVPVDLFLELVPGLNILPATNVTAGGGIGVRVYF